MGQPSIFNKCYRIIDPHPGIFYFHRNVQAEITNQGANYSYKVKESKLITEIVLNNKLTWVAGLFWKENVEDKQINLDLFGYKLSIDSNDQEKWKKNPEVYNWIISMTNLTDIQKIETHYATCERGIILLGNESEYRLTTSNLKEYFTKEPPFHKAQNIKTVLVTPGKKNI